jgi:hypothetical protein
MRAFTVIMALLFGLATLPVSSALAQNEGGNRPTARTDAQKKEDKDIDDAYRAATRGVPNQATKVDPWSKVRAPDADKKPK